MIDPRLAADTITNDQLTLFAGLITAGALLLSVVLVYVANRANASVSSISAVSSAFAELTESLRRELDAERKARKEEVENERNARREALEGERKARQEEAERYQDALLAEVAKRVELERRFESERLNYQKYISQLREVMIRFGIDEKEIPEWNGDE